MRVTLPEHVPFLLTGHLVQRPTKIRESTRPVLGFLRSAADVVRRGQLVAACSTPEDWTRQASCRIYGIIALVYLPRVGTRGGHPLTQKQNKKDQDEWCFLRGGRGHTVFPRSSIRMCGDETQEEEERAEAIKSGVEVH